MDDLNAWWAALAGLAIGAAVGFTTRRARLCSFGAIEDALVGFDTRRLRVFGLALGIAIAGTQFLVVAGLLDPRATSYVPEALPWIGVALGGVMFGLGMALVGTCAFGSCVRLGSGDLRSLVVLLVFSATAYAMLRGTLAAYRITFGEAMALTMPLSAQADLPGLIDPILGLSSRAVAAAGVAAVLIALAVMDMRLRKARRLLAAGIVLGLGVVAGWLATEHLVDEFVHAARPQSLTFVAPAAITLYGLLLDGTMLVNFGTASIIGVIVGAFAAAHVGDEFRWEAFDDAREMRRHLLGAVLMGVGGVLCGGCTIGQGITAGSLLALSFPLAVAGMVLGARLGIAFLMEGRAFFFLRASPRSAAGRSRLVGGRRSRS
ncbi:YeeE/YedE family protein, partial [Bosea sp. 117]|uniref:YeeE/YedE family protein n=1 Tax=Bosea sp. 117 TaxID=1125973 RepID=UPI0004942F78